MAEQEHLGASFSIDVSNLKAGLTQANRLIKESRSEFQAAAAEMGDWTKSEDGFIAKNKELNKILDVQNAVLDAYEKQMEEAGYAQNDMSKEAVELRTKINEQRVAIAKTKSAIEDNNNAFDEYKQSLQEVGNEAEDTGDELQELGKDAKEAGDGFTIAKGAAADFIGNGLTALVGACKNAISSIAGLADETREFRQDIGTLETAFSEAGFTVEQGTDTWKKLYGVFGEDDRAVEAANNISRMAKSQEELNDWVAITTGIWGTYQDALPVEGLAEAAGETAKVGKVTGVMADALNWSTEAADKFASYMNEDVTNAEDAFNVALSECNTEAERQALITETLTDLYGDANDKYRENNDTLIQANESQADYLLTMGELGDKIEPVTTKIKEGFNKILEKILELTEGVDIEGFANRISGAFDTFTDDVIPAITDGLQWIIDNKDIIIAGLTGMATALGAYVAYTTAIKIMKDGWLALEVVQKAVAAAQVLMNTVMALNPIGLVIAAVVGLVAAFVILWKKCDGFREFWIGLWDKVKEAASTAWEFIKDTFSKLGDFFGGLWDTIKEKFTSIGTKIGEAIGGAFKSAINAVLATVEKGINTVPNAINKALDLINALPGVNISPMKTVQLPRLAKGGVVRGATQALIGEDGAEAIVPLERNTEWLDKVADKIAEKSGGVVINQTNNYSQAHSRLELYKTKQQTAAAVRLAMGR